jgi:hypothetical protein
MNAISRKMRRVLGLSTLVVAFFALQGTSEANYGPICQNATYGGFRTIPAHTICSERVVGRFTADQAFGNGSYAVWLKDYLIYPFGVHEAVLQTTYYKSYEFGTPLSSLITNYDPHGLDSNHIVCGAVANIWNRSESLDGAYLNGLAKPYNVDCDAAVSRFTGLPVVH